MGDFINHLLDNFSVVYYRLMLGYCLQFIVLILSDIEGESKSNLQLRSNVAVMKTSVSFTAMVNQEHLIRGI